MVKLNTKGKPLLLMINGELFGVEEISRNPTSSKTEQSDITFLTIKAVKIKGQRKLTIHIDPRLINVLKEENKALPYIH